jgi:leucyl aminopeptidase (aminopeptidase T)
MAWPEKEKIVFGVENMLKVNMGLKPGEPLLVVTDIPTTKQWNVEPRSWIIDVSERAMLAKLVAEIAAERFPDNPVMFHPFPATGSHGKEPDGSTAALMRKPQVILAITTYSLSHTNARLNATKAGARIASMPGFEAGMLEEGGPMAVDYLQVSRDCHIFATRLTSASQVQVKTPAGTDLRFSIAGRTAHVDDGLYNTDAKFGNLPAGEAYIVPVEGTGEGTLVVQAGWYPSLTEDMVLVFEKGEVVELEGGGDVGRHFKALLQIGNPAQPYKSRRNLAELGIGTNPNAKRPDNVLEAEKIKGTIHIAIGDDIHMGGSVEADLHEDFVQPEPTLILDGEVVIDKGDWKIG